MLNTQTCDDSGKAESAKDERSRIYIYAACTICYRNIITYIITEIVTKNLIICECASCMHQFKQLFK